MTVVAATAAATAATAATALTLAIALAIAAADRDATCYGFVFYHGNEGYSSLRSTQFGKIAPSHDFDGRGP